MKRNIVLLAVAAALVSSSLFGVSPAQADGSTASTPTVTASDAMAGGSMPVSAQGFHAGETVSFTLTNLVTVKLGGGVADAAGDVAQDFVVPVSVVTGTYQLTATGVSSSLSATVPVQVTGTGQYFLVKFDVRGGKPTTAAKSVKYKAAYGSLPKTTRTGYTFSGWYTAKSGGTKVSSLTKLTAKAGKTVYAHWQAKSYKVTFNVNGGKALRTSSKQVKMDKSYGALPKPTRTGYSFQGWFTAKSGGNKVASTSKFTKAASQTLYARWAAKSYTVYLKPQSGTVSPTSIKVTYNSTYQNLPTPTRAHYSFSGWYTKASGGTKVTNSKTVKITASQTLYAQWKAEVVNVPDAKLKACINDSLRQSKTHSITAVQAQSVKALYCEFMGITSVTGIAGFTNLTVFDVFGNKVSDISPLAGLKKLTTLDLSENRISDVSTLAGLTSLTHLDLDTNQISNITPLAGLTKLTELWLNENQIADISPLAGMTQMKNLQMESNQISDVSPLSGMSKLTKLWLSDNSITSAALAKAPLPSSLTLLYLDDTQVSDLSPLTNLVNLDELGLDGNGITNLAPLTSLTRLTDLNVCYNSISDLSPLADMTSLAGLGLCFNQISDLTPLAGLTGLQILGLNANQITDVKPLATLVNLEVLSLRYNYICDRTPLAGLKKTQIDWDNQTCNG